MARLVNTLSLQIIAAITRWVNGAFATYDLYNGRVERIQGNPESVTFRIHNWMSQPQCAGIQIVDGGTGREVRVRITKVLLNQATHAYGGDATHVDYVDVPVGAGLNLTIAPAMAAFIEVEYTGWAAGSTDPNIQIVAHNAGWGEPIVITHPDPAFNAPTITTVSAPLVTP